MLKEHYPGDESLLLYEELPNGTIIGIYPVIYGFRIRAGYAMTSGESPIMYSYELDYCAGADGFYIQGIYAMVKHILVNNSDFKQFPRQDIKPIQKDTKVFTKLVNLATSYTGQWELPDISRLSELRENYLGSIFVK
jgi:hypothetical protein